MALQRFFFPFGAILGDSAAVVASSAPTPRPVTKRKMPKVVAVWVKAVAAMPSENQA